MTSLQDRLQASTERFLKIRRNLHAHPELGEDTLDTAALVTGLLEGWGYEVHTGVGGHGVVGVLRRGSGTRTLGLRADMDALPIIERNGLPWASQRAGVMHACGHDGHTATLLAAAEQLALHGEFDGTLNLIFQPDEEGLTGARSMMADGLFRRFPCDAVYAFHNMPGFPVGYAIIKSGGVMASSERVGITLTGKGGHGAVPERAVDPIPALAGIISALQTVVSRNISANDAVVISIGKVQAGTATNIIPESAMLELSVRTVDPAIRQQVEQRIRTIVEGQAAAFGVTAEIDYQLLAPVLVTPSPRRNGCSTPQGPGQRERGGASVIQGHGQRGFCLDAGRSARLLFRPGQWHRGVQRLLGAQRSLRLQRSIDSPGRSVLGGTGRRLLALRRLVLGVPRAGRPHTVLCRPALHPPIRTLPCQTLPPSPT